MQPDLDAWIAEVAKSSYGWEASLRFTYDKTRELLAAGVPGDLVECGVGNGVHPAAMAKACIDVGETRTIRLFDSFIGLPNGGPRDIEWNSAHPSDGLGSLLPVGVSACSRRNVAENLMRWEGRTLDFDHLRALNPLDDVVTLAPYVFHEGWFQQTVPDYADDQPAPIAFLRLDGDLYDSYRVCLEHLYPLVSSGGIVVVDDWNLDGCREAVRDYFMGVYGDDAPMVLLRVEEITESGDVWWTKP